MAQTIFNTALRLINQEKVSFEFENRDSSNYMIKGTHGDYAFKIYPRIAESTGRIFAWFAQCGCDVGVSNKPLGLCKHSVAAVVIHFLKLNELRLIDKNGKIMGAYIPGAREGPFEDSNNECNKDQD